MKNLFLVVLALCVYIPQANAQKVKDQEFRRVVVTLTSGEKVEGYVRGAGMPKPPLSKRAIIPSK